MTDITIPPAALEAAAEDLFHMQYGDSKGSWSDAPEWLKVTIRSEARAALLAGLKAWPGMGPIRTDQPIGDWCDKLPAIILPLSENTND